MKIVKSLICIVFAAMALTACTNDNPVVPQDDPTVVNVDNPQEEVTDQPAAARN